MKKSLLDSNGKKLKVVQKRHGQTSIKRHGNAANL